VIFCSAVCGDRSPAAGNWVVGSLDQLAVDELCASQARVTSCQVLIMHHRRWADSINPNAMASAVAFDPWSLVTLVRSLTVAKVD
jgi:hypothetical protein